MALTPMMCQYLDIKAQNKDAILFFRLGDFYEMFYDDAKTASRELDLTLTGKDCGAEERAPMCGIPYHSADPYIAKLVSKGYKVVICEQVEDPAEAKGLVKRDIIRIVTPGTVIDGNMLNETKNNYLASIFLDSAVVGVSFIDISTGDVSATRFSGSSMMEALINELGLYSPSEVILSTSGVYYPKLVDFLKGKLNAVINDNQDSRFQFGHARELVIKQFGEASDESAVVSSVGALLDYTAETQRMDVSYIKKLNVYSEGQFLELDLNTRRNLELCETMRSKEKKGSLLWVLDKTRTSMGARLLRKWVEQPLVNSYFINRRQSAVAELAGNFMVREELSDALKKTLDLERIMARVVYGTANAKDLRAIASTISVIPEICSAIENCSSDEIVSVCNNFDRLTDIYALINSAIADEPPFSLREGKIIKKGYNEQVDEFNTILNDSKSYIERIESEEREKTGIKTLKVGYNRVFGYYIEVSKSFINDVPEGYIRRQTLANGERFITEKLKEIESTILGASDKVVALEYELFQRVRETVAENVARIQDSAAKLALLDTYLSLADVAANNNYVRPEVEYGETIKIKDGRHPVVEQFVTDSYFVPNDTHVDTQNNRLLLITGPNMAGKSTYMRQVALITLMAQIGSFVPAKEAEIGIVDKIFTRVGASDDLASGQSTFMLEMNEVAYIVKHATKRSLIIYDEIGRGTSTFDGMSIARAVAEYTAGRKLGAKTLFATHYHELTELENSVSGVVNYNIAAKKRGDEVTFLRKIIKGAADDSYGIEVAKLAGVPNDIIKRAKEILKELESHSLTSTAEIEKPVSDNITFDDFKSNDIAERLKNIDINTLSPIEALNLLFELKRMLD